MMKNSTANSESASSVIGQLAGEVTSALRQGQPLSLEELQAKCADSQVNVDVVGFAQTLTLLEEAAFQRCSRHMVPGVIDDTGRRRTSLGGFELIREISRGGMGIVYEATQNALNRRVAIKVLPPSPLLTEAERERFRREGRAAAKLHHEHIVPVFATGSEHGILYCVMQLIEGFSLDEILSYSRNQRDGLRPTEQFSDGSSVSALRSLVKQLGFYSRQPEPDTIPVDDCPGVTVPQIGSDVSTRWQRIAGIGADLAGALQHAHQQQVLHRDIKPGNVLLDRHGRPWLADFGLARLRDCSNLTEAGGWLGTLRYSAPEQLDGRADERSDIYALGITLYELCTLEPAFPASDRAELVHDLLHSTPKPPRELEPEIPRDLETILLKAISREPGDRYSTADELRSDLQRFLNDRPPTARRYGRTELMWRWCRRNRREATLISLLVLTFFAFTLTMTLAYFKEARLRASADLIAATAHSALDRVYEAYLPGFSESLLGQASGSLPVSTEAAELLEQLATFYNQLQGHSELSTYSDENLNGFLKSEAAIRRVALIYLRLGEFEKSRQLLTRSSEQLFYQIQEQTNPEVLLEYVRVRNDLAAIDWLNRPVWTNRSIDNMDAELQMTLRFLKKYSPINTETDPATQKDISYERARTLYLLGRSIRRQSRGSLHHRDIPAIKFEIPSEKKLRILSEAVTLLEQLRCDNPHEISYRFLQALA